MEQAKTIAEITARILLDTKAVLFNPDQPYTFTSGRVSPIYVDCRRLISFPRARSKLMDMMCSLFEETVGFDQIDAVAGGETAGIPFAAFVAERMHLPMLYIRKKPKGFGRGSQIEGLMDEGSRVLLVEDLASEGTSKLNFVRAIRAADGKIGHTIVVFNYGIYPQSVATLSRENVQLHALANFRDVMTAAAGMGSFTSAQVDALEAYAKDPDAWSVERGGTKGGDA